VRHQQSSTDGTPGQAAAPQFDPADLPLRCAAPDAGADGGTRTVLVERTRVLVTRRRDGMAMHLAVPMRDYLGVAARVLADARGEDRLEVALVHRDRDLDVALYEASDDGEVVSRWRRWAAALALPLLFERVDGTLVALDRRIGALVAAPPLPRRPRVGRTRLRPRFMRRRRMGQPFPALR
jgi:hypothetical protein